jgi:hypothetical protein
MTKTKFFVPLILMLFFGLASSAFSQQRENMTVADCDSIDPKPRAGTGSYTYVDTQGKLCTNASSSGGASETTLLQAVTKLTDILTQLESTLSVSVASALPAGDNNIGNADIATVPPDPFGANADPAATAGGTGTIQAKLRYITSRISDMATDIAAILADTTPVPVTYTARQFQVPLTAITFTESGGSAVFTPKNIATGAGRVSAQFDRGAGALATVLKWEATFKAGSAVTIGLPVRVYAYCSESASSAADLAADGGVSVETLLSNFTVLGEIIANANSVGPFYATGKAWLEGRYCVVGLWNASGQTLTNVNGDNKITLTPIPFQSVTQ